MKKVLTLPFNKKNKLETTDDLVALGFWAILNRRPKTNRPARETENNTHAKFLRENKLRYIDGYVWINWYLFNISAMWYKQVSLHDAKERRYKFDKIFTPQASNREVC